MNDGHTVITVPRLRTHLLKFCVSLKVDHFVCASCAPHQVSLLVKSRFANSCHTVFIYCTRHACTHLVTVSVTAYDHAHWHWVLVADIMFMTNLMAWLDQHAIHDCRDFVDRVYKSSVSIC